MRHRAAGPKLRVEMPRPAHRNDVLAGSPVRRALAWLAAGLAVIVAIVVLPPRWAAAGWGAPSHTSTEVTPAGGTVDRAPCPLLTAATDDATDGQDEDGALGDSEDQDGDDAAVRSAVAAPDRDRPSVFVRQSVFPSGPGLPSARGHGSAAERPPRAA